MTYQLFLTQLRCLQLQGNAVGGKCISNFFFFFLNSERFECSFLKNPPRYSLFQFCYTVYFMPQYCVNTDINQAGQLPQPSCSHTCSRSCSSSLPYQTHSGSCRVKKNYRESFVFPSGAQVFIQPEVL